MSAWQSPPLSFEDFYAENCQSVARALAITLGEGEVALRDDSLDGAIAGLPVDHRAVVVCRIHLDWSVAQTAEALDIAPGTVKSRLARAL